MKNYRKQPVEAIQWDGHPSAIETLDKLLRDMGFKQQTLDVDILWNLKIGYTDSRGRNHQTLLPLNGWVVIEGKILQFYKDKTFRHTFKAAEEDSKGIDWDGMTDTINKAFEGFDDIFKGFHGVSHKDNVDALNKKARSANISNGAQRLYDFLRRGCVSRAEAEKHLLGGVTFDSVLDEMKELHAKKNKDYGDAAHVNFLKYGPVASLSRLSEKMQRAEHIFLSGKNEVKDEPLTATLIDMAITSAMLYMELKNKDND
jgi:hypothetical protein